MLTVVEPAVNVSLCMLRPPLKAFACALALALKLITAPNSALSAVAAVIQYIDTNSFARMVFEDIETNRFSSLDIREVELP